MGDTDIHSEYKVTIRNFKPADLEAILEIEEKSFREHERYNAEIFLYYHALFPDLFIVAILRDNIVGYAMGEIRGGMGHLVSIAVHPCCRGRGIGTRLLHEFENRVRKRGANIVYLEVAVSNTPAINLYKKQGYRITGVIKGYYDDEDAYVMAKHL